MAGAVRASSDGFKLLWKTAEEQEEEEEEAAATKEISVNAAIVTVSQRS